jgi:hypothetical protein
MFTLYGDNNMNKNKPQYQIIQVRHYGVPFEDSACARLLVTGMFHHWILLLL